MNPNLFRKKQQEQQEWDKKKPTKEFIKWEKDYRSKEEIINAIRREEEAKHTAKVNKLRKISDTRIEYMIGSYNTFSVQIDMFIYGYVYTVEELKEEQKRRKAEHRKKIIEDIIGE